MNKITKFLIIFILFWLYGCANVPLSTKPLIESQKYTSKENTHTIQLNPLFRDERKDQFKTEKCFILDRQFLGVTYSFGDAMYDKSLYTAFKKMFITRFGNSQTGHKVEVTLKAFYYTNTPNTVTFLPIIGVFLGRLAKGECHGILKTEVTFLDQENKFIFNKIYDIDVKEIPAKGKGGAFDMYIKAFNKFAEKFETDIKRIKF